MPLTKVVDGKRVELTEQEEQQVYDEWNAPRSEADWMKKIAATRYKHEIAGTTFTHSDGQTYGVATDRESQTKAIGASVQAKREQDAGNTSWSKRWKTAQGFVTLTINDALALGDAVDAHVQACFDREADLRDMVDDGTITDSDLEEGWP